MSNLELVNAILYVTENGCKWRALPESYGNWHTVYVRMNRWSKNGVLQRLFEGLPQANMIRIRMEAVCLDSTSLKVHPNGTGAFKKVASKESGVRVEGSQPRFTWSPPLTVRLFHSRSPQETPATARKDEDY